MPKRRDINKVMVIGSGPIVIGQAAEFDMIGEPLQHLLGDDDLVHSVTLAAPGVLRKRSE